jgi:hypothetical protein
LKGKYVIKIVGEIELELADTEVTYDGDEHTITVSADPDDAVLTYSETEDGEYSETIPVYTEVGEYTVYVKAKKKYYTTATGSAQVTISKEIYTGDALALTKEISTITSGVLPVDLDEFLALLASEPSLGTVTYEVVSLINLTHVLSTYLLDDNILTINYNQAFRTNNATFAIKIHSSNYEDISATLYIKAKGITGDPSIDIRYGVIIIESTGGLVISDKGTELPGVFPGETVTLTIETGANYKFEKIVVARQSDESVVIKLTGEGNTRTFTMPDFVVTVRTTFNSLTGVNNPESADLKATSTGSGLLITGLQANELFRVYSLQGTLIYQGKATSTETFVNLPVRGIYIVAAGDRKIKAIN